MSGTVPPDQGRQQVTALHRLALEAHQPQLDEHPT